MSEIREGILGWLKSSWEDPSKAVSIYPSTASTHMPHLRLVQAMAQDREGEQKMGHSDFLVLLRAVIRHEKLSLTIPASIAPDIDISGWKEASLEVSETASGNLRVKANPWQPQWLPQSSVYPPDEDPAGMEIRRENCPVPADPILYKFGFDSYKSTAQREAIRTILCAPKSSTIIVNLPTGSGKSICAFAPAFQPMEDESALPGLSIIVVPTVALSLDLDSKLSQITNHSIAYHSGNHQAMYEAKLRCTAGVQGPIIVSPESLIDSLKKSVCEAARKGFLRYFVVDEAHMVTAWGDEFRPAFQQIAGIRRELLRLSEKRPFKTILMSATLTEHHIKTLQELFGEPGPVHHIHAVKLRPEPSYWNVMARNPGEKEKWLFEAIFNLPRPLILYTLKREDAKSWYHKLKKTGFERVGMFHGDTGRQTRLGLLEDWNKNKIDIMVATSAFGLGVDKPDVRVILHAALPESVDRFYQDVGRGGRDGHASNSLMIWTGKDWKDAGGMLSPKFITGERGRYRWLSMFYSDRKKHLGDNRFSIPIDVPPTMNPEDIDMYSELNEKWNVRTLLLMARTGLIEIDSQVNGTTENSDNNSNISQKMVTVRILDSLHADPETWEEDVENRRAELYGRSHESRKLLERLTHLQQNSECISKIFQDCYTSESLGVPVVSSCGGCPKCRSMKYPAHGGKMQARHSPKNQPFAPLPIGDELNEFLKGGNLGLIFYKGSEMEETKSETFIHLAKWLIIQGVINMVVPDPILKKLHTHFIENPHWCIFLRQVVPYPSDIAYKQPTAFFVRNNVIDSRLWSILQNPQSKLIAILSENSHPPGRPDRWAKEILVSPTKMNIHEWYEEYVE